MNWIINRFKTWSRYDTAAVVCLTIALMQAGCASYTPNYENPGIDEQWHLAKEWEDYAKFELEYSSDDLRGSTQSVTMPDEMRITKTGDCEDFALLSYQWLKNKGYSPRFEVSERSGGEQHAVTILGSTVFTNNVTQSLTDYRQGYKYKTGHGSGYTFTGGYRPLYVVDKDGIDCIDYMHCSAAFYWNGIIKSL